MIYDSILVGIYKHSALDEIMDNSYPGLDNEIYFFGLIDTLQTYTVNKWLEKRVKKSQSCLRSVLSPSLFSLEQPADLPPCPDEISVEEPVRYGKRLLDFFHKL
jgi:Phosphatidylinositol-4-phosphate 5-Kinase